MDQMTWNGKSRPFGGVEAYLKDQKFHFKSSSAHHIEIEIDNNFSLFGIYLPANDSRYSQDDNLIKLNKALSYIPCKKNFSELFIGDFNSGPQDSTKRSVYIKNFFDSRGIFIEKFDSKQKFSFLSKINSSERLLDRCLVSPNLNTTNFEFKTDNIYDSDHFPVQIILDYNFKCEQIQQESTKRINIHKTNKNSKCQNAYSKLAEYRCKAFENFTNVNLSATELLNLTIDTLSRTALETLPKVKSQSKNSKTLIGYNSCLKQLKSKVLAKYHQYQHSKKIKSPLVNLFKMEYNNLQKLFHKKLKFLKKKARPN